MTFVSRTRKSPQETAQAEHAMVKSDTTRHTLANCSQRSECLLGLAITRHFQSISQSLFERNISVVTLVRHTNPEAHSRPAFASIHDDPPIASRQSGGAKQRRLFRSI